MRHDRDKYSQSKGVKPKKRVYCADSMRQKMKFDTEKEAEDFIKWNRANFDDKIPSRIYWCEACCGYHITARPMGGVGVTINMKLPYLTEALKTDNCNRWVSAYFNSFETSESAEERRKLQQELKAIKDVQRLIEN